MNQRGPLHDVHAARVEPLVVRADDREGGEPADVARGSAMTREDRPSWIVFVHVFGEFVPGSDLLLSTQYAHEALYAIALLEALAPRLRFRVYRHDGPPDACAHVLSVEDGHWRVVNSSKVAA